MLYGTGGLALTDGRASNFFTDYFSPSETGGSSKSNILIGYVVGGGAEWALDRQWSLKTEYLFLNFGSISTSVSDLNTPGSGFGNNALATKVDLDAQIVRVGLNHKF
jgi:outer membrane immunogenic protein